MGDKPTFRLQILLEFSRVHSNMSFEHFLESLGLTDLLFHNYSTPTYLGLDF